MVTTNCEYLDYVCMKSDSSGPTVVTTSTWGNCYKASGGWLVGNKIQCTDNQYIATPSAYMAQTATTAAQVDIASSSGLAIGFSHYLKTQFIFEMLVVLILAILMGGVILKK